MDEGVVLSVGFEANNESEVSEVSDAIEANEAKEANEYPY